MKPPKHQPDTNVMAHYIGLFELTSVDRRAKITGAEIAVDYTELPPQWPLGRIAVRGVDPNGQQTSWTGAIYNWRGKGTVSAQILNQGDLSVMGHIRMYDPTARNTEGYLELDGRWYHFTANRYDDDDGPPPDPHVTQTGPRFTQANDAGWPRGATGAYTMTNVATDPGAGAGVFAPVVRLTRSLDTGGSTAPTGGSLSVSGSGASLQGTMRVERPSTDETYYLTTFKSGGISRSAELHTGSASGPTVGVFKGTLVDGELAGAITVDGKSTDVSFQAPK
ncbi:MAG TPA: hypothetical protein VGM91_08350 [Conexibacter sp.]